MGVNGKHEVRLERIERSLSNLHGKMDDMIETGAVNEADILWLKWAVRGLIAIAVAGGGAVLGGRLNW